MTVRKNIKTGPSNLVLTWIVLLWVFWGSNASAELVIPKLSDRLMTDAFVQTAPEKDLLISIVQAGTRWVASGARGTIVYSDNHGTDWHAAEVPVSSLVTSVYFVDDRYGWAVGHGGVVLHSQDGGKRWHVQMDGHAANEKTVSHLQASHAELQGEYDEADEYDQEDLAYALDDMLFALEDAQFDLEMGPTKPLLDVWFRDRKEGYVVGAYGSFFQTLDGGATWHYAADRLENFDRYHLNAITRLVGGTLMIVGEGGQMFASYDAGETWETLYGPYTGSFFGLQATDEEGVAIAYGLRGNVYKTTDGGSSWEKIEVPIETTLTGSSYAPGGQVALVGFSGVVLLSQDNGNTFYQAKEGSFSSYNDIVLSENKGAVIVGDAGVVHLDQWPNLDDSTK